MSKRARAEKFIGRTIRTEYGHRLYVLAVVVVTHADYEAAVARWKQTKDDADFMFVNGRGLWHEKKHALCFKGQLVKGDGDEKIVKERVIYHKVSSRLRYEIES